MSSNVKWITGGVLIIAIVWLRAWWMTPPAVEFDNLRYIQLLRTAVSARNSEWLNKVASAVDQRLAEGAMSRSEHSHFGKLIAQARSGAWEAADKECFRFEEAQLNRRRSRPASEQHDHDHAG